MTNPLDSEDLLNVYVKPGCPWCINVVQFLEEGEYEFKEIDVLADDAKFAEMEAISGQTFAPTMRVGTNNDMVLADFGVDELKAFLAEHKIQA